MFLKVNGSKLRYLSSIALVAIIVSLVLGMWSQNREREPKISKILKPEVQPPKSNQKPLKVKLVNYAVIATRNISKGEKFDRESVIETDSYKISPAPSFENAPDTSAYVLGHRAAKDIPKGKLITNDDILKTLEDMR